MIHSSPLQRTAFPACQTGVADAAGDRLVSWVFPAERERAGQVRRLVSAHLKYWKQHRVEGDVVLATEEAFTNAVLHGSQSRAETVKVELERSEGHLRVAVSDGSPTWPVPRVDEDPLAEGGRGLAIITALSDGWGVVPADEGTGKTFWFSLKAASTLP
ncbi:ATP-binding protein [Streptomyces sp. NPDC046862]|uniref:ATP-binding protein n=1 Tax=Streptomyces sp. NPDC046862 TaxID=3154603 RepID=UPI003452B480